VKRALLLLTLLPPALAAQEAAPADSSAEQRQRDLDAARVRMTAPKEALCADAAAVRPLLTTDFARSFVDATAALPLVMPRILYSDADQSHWYTLKEAWALGGEALLELKKHELDVGFYWNTRYGTPVAYARAIDLAAQRGLQSGGAVADFGCGGLGALRLLASNGCRVVGIDVDPMLKKLYSEPEDTGAILSVRPGGRSGQLSLEIGQWPGDASLAGAVREAVPDGADLFLSKNTLKRGYIHPAEPVDPRRLVHLGVGDEEFVAAVFAALRPGGLFMIYNLCPAPAAAGQPYIPWADGHCPFPRELLEAAGLQVLDFDVVDDEAARAMGHALGWDQGEGAMNLQDDLFAWFTVARRPAAGDPK
jgi:hypothetical protein